MKTFEKLITLVSLALIVPGLSSCNLRGIRTDDDFSYTHCANRWSVKSDVLEASADADPTLTLAYKDNSLCVLLKNAQINCAYESLYSDVDVYGNDIYVTVSMTGSNLANCICRLDEVLNVVKGLKKGEDYTLHFSFDSVHLAPIDFHYSSFLNITLDYYQNVVSNPYPV